HPYDQMDMLLWGHTNEIAPADLAEQVGLEVADVEAGYREIDRKRVATEYLHASAVLLDSTD
ncbi:MAG: NAD(+) synthase, partial [Solirubrobacterales bacterium]